jgi:serine/threonine protein kinase
MQVLAGLPRSGDSGAAHGVSGEPLGDLGEYRLIREVGRGGMGVVYEAEQRSLRRRVALKVLPWAAAMDPKQLQRFKNEALAAASLKHDHIVSVYAVGCERGVHYYAMEFVEGQTLAAVIDAMASRERSDRRRERSPILRSLMLPARPSQTPPPSLPSARKWAAKIAPSTAAPPN